MLRINIFIVLICLFVSCKKETSVPTTVATTPTTPKWQDEYPNNGILPDWTISTNNKNELVGTKWVLTKIINGFGTTIMYDTLNFVSNTKYYVGSDTSNSALYTLYSSQNNMTLTFKPLISVNYLHCSTDQLGVGFGSGNQIIGVEFVNLYDSNTKFKAWFTKI
jgi:hypothetical protein